MRVLTPRIVAVLDGDAHPVRSARRAAAPAASAAAAGSAPTPSASSAAAVGASSGGSGSARIGMGRSSVGALGGAGFAAYRGSETVRSAGCITAPLMQHQHYHSASSGSGSSRANAAAATPGCGGAGGSEVGSAFIGGGDGEDCSAFDLLHTEKGFVAFEQWYRRGLAQGPAARMPAMPRPELGVLWPQAFVPSNALHEHAFMELLRVFAECSDSEAMDLFDLLDYDFLGMLGLPQVYMAMCLIAALGCRQLTKFLYFHSAALFGMLASGCRLCAAPDHVTWPRTLTLVRLLGAPGYLISKLSIDFGMTFRTQLKYEDFLEVAWAVAAQLDRGADVAEIMVINESDRSGVVKSKTCAIL